jgi:hypothetical protein
MAEFDQYLAIVDWASFPDAGELLLFKEFRQHTLRPFR